MEVVHHLNPYTTIPILEPHNDPSYILSNWHELLSPYGPLFTLLTFAVVPLGVAASFWVLKGILALRQPGDDLPRVEVRAAAGPRSAGGGRARRPQPDRARVGARGRPQRLPDGLLHHARLLPAAAGARARSGREGAAGDCGALVVARLRAWLRRCRPPTSAAGAAFVTAVAIKASAAVLIPVVLAGLLRAPRALVRVVLGMVVAGAVRRRGQPARVRPAHPRPEHPEPGSSRSVSVPNLIGLALGAGRRDAKACARS